MQLLTTYFAVALLLAVSFTTDAEARDDTARVLITWDGEGTVYEVSTTQKLFQGAFEGVLYVETGEGVLDEAFVRCPGSLAMNLDSKTVSGEGSCAIYVDVDETIFSQWKCEGQIGACKGEFSIVEGTGRFEGMSGSGAMSIRSPLRVLAGNMPTGSTVRVHSGVMHIPALEYQIPAK